jgi:beta-fructofuranosidase
VLTPDGRRVMWSWLTTLDPAINQKTVQSLPRELSLGEDGTLRIHPLRELETLRYDALTVEDIVCSPGGVAPSPIAELDGDSYELRIRIERGEAERRRLGVLLFAGEEDEGMPVIIRPESGTICVGDVEAPFAVADLPQGEDVDLRIFIDKYLVEVFVNGRQAALDACMGYRDAGIALKAYCFHGRDNVPATIKKVEIWKLRPTNQGFLEAQSNRIWEPDTQ